MAKSLQENKARGPTIEILMYIERVLSETFLWTVIYLPTMGLVKARKLGVRSNKICFLKLCRIMGIDQLTFVKSCRQLGRRGILSQRDNYNLYGYNMESSHRSSQEIF